MKKKSKGKLHVSFLAMTMIPMFCLWLVISVVCINEVKEVMTNQTKSNLQTVVYSVTTAYSDMINDEVFYHLEEDGEFYLMKGEECLNFDMNYIEGLKEKTGMDISFFYENIRVMTTLKDSSGDYLTGTTVKDIIKRNVVDDGEEYFAENVYIDDVKCFSYYAPLYNPDGTIFGMVGISQSADMITKDIIRVVTPMLVIAVVLMIIAASITAVYSESIVRIIEKTKNFLSKVAVGNLSCTISNDVIKRDDEIGDIGRAAVNMQKSLREFVQKDALTGLLNRRYGQMAFDEVITHCEKTGEKYSIAIGDIDFFKKVNDTYGHEAGDDVLSAVADVLGKHMTGKGYAVRWGGEEFLLIFRGISEDAAKYILEEILNQIREMVVVNEGREIKVTMTFGVIEKSEEIANSDIINKADELLYYGKTNGRNRIVRRDDIG